MQSADRYCGRLTTAEAAVAAIRADDVVLWACLAEPLGLDEAFAAQSERLRGLRMVHDLPLRPHPWHAEGFEDFRVYDNFPGPTTREPIASGQVEFIPWPFGLSRASRSTAPGRTNYFGRPDVYLALVTEPDAEGYVSFGNFPWFWKDAIDHARLVIGEISPAMPRTSARMHASAFAALLPPASTSVGGARGMPPTPEAEAEAAIVIASHVADLIEDGDCIQIGVGAGSEAMYEFLRQRRRLGMHTETIAATYVELIRSGVVDGSRKTFLPGKAVLGGVGLPPLDPFTPEAVVFLREHPEAFEFPGLGNVCNVKNIAANDNMVAINSALSCDLTGQLTVNNLGTVPISGLGANFDFTVGAHYSEGGRAVHCLVSTAKGGTVSRIVGQHPPGAVVSIPRTMIDYLATEWGMVNLEGKSLSERAAAIVSVAHPDFREALTQEARRLGLA